MRTQKLVKDVAIVAGLIVSLLISLLIVSSQKELSISEPTQAHEKISPTKNNAKVTPTPTLEANPNNDFPLISKGAYYATNENTLYTELLTEPTVSNYTQSNVQITWITSAPLLSTLRVGMHENILNRSFEDVNTNKTTYLHSVILTALNPGRQYYFSGHSPFTNSFTLPKIEGTAPRNIKISGTIENYSTSCFVRGVIEHEGVYSTEVTSFHDDGKWLLDLSQLLAQDFSSYIAVQDEDNITIDVLCLNSKGFPTSASVSGTVGELSKTSPIIRVK